MATTTNRPSMALPSRRAPMRASVRSHDRSLLQPIWLTGSIRSYNYKHPIFDQWLSTMLRRVTWCHFKQLAACGCLSSMLHIEPRVPANTDTHTHIYIHICIQVHTYIHPFLWMPILGQTKNWWLDFIPVSGGKSPTSTTFEVNFISVSAKLCCLEGMAILVCKYQFSCLVFFSSLILCRVIEYMWCFVIGWCCAIGVSSIPASHQEALPTPWYTDSFRVMVYACCFKASKLIVGWWMHRWSMDNPLSTHCWSIVDVSLIHRWSTVQHSGSTVNPSLIHRWSIVDPLLIHCWSIVYPLLI